MMALTAAQKKAERIAAQDETRVADYRASLPETFEQPLSQTDFDALVGAADAAGAAGDADMAAGDLAAAAAGGTPINPVIVDPADAAADLLAKQEAARIAAADLRDRQSAYDIL